MKPFLPSSLFAALALLTLTAAPAFSAIIVTLPTATVAGSIVITEDINFTITTAGGAVGFFLDEWVTTDGSREFVGLSPNQLSYSINGGSPMTAPLDSLADNLDFAANDVTANDGYLYTSSPITVALNDVYRQIRHLHSRGRFTTRWIQFASSPDFQWRSIYHRLYRCSSHC